MEAAGRIRRAARTSMLVAGSAVGVWLAVRAARYADTDPIAAARDGGGAALALGAVALAVLLRRRGRRLLQAARRHPVPVRLGLVVVALLLGLLATEGLLRLRPSYGQPSDVIARSEPFVVPDPQLGYRPVRDREVEVAMVRASDGQDLGHVRYGFGRDGRRRTVLPRAAGHDRAVVFFGCSQTFGHGLDDADTLPSRYAAHMPQDYVVNCAVPGYGPNQALALVRGDEDLGAPTLPRPPVAVFVWIDHHLRRLCGSLRVRSQYGVDAPCFAAGPDGDAVLRGPFRTAEPWRSVWCWALAKSELLKLCGYDWPAEDRKEDRELAFAVLRSLALAWRERCGGRLLLVQYPTQREAEALAPRLAALGADFAFESLDGLFDPYADGMSVDRDGHPTPTATELLGARIAAAVQRAFP